MKRVKFATAALSWNWAIPAEMAALAEPDKREVEILNLKQQVEALTQERDTWKHKEAGHEHYSEKLTTLIQAATKFWANAKPDRPDTQPEKSDVVAWLMKMGFLSTPADRAATIIRPEWAHKGRKPNE